MKKYLSFFKIIIVFNFIIYSLLNECNRTYPILKNNKCVSTFCNEEQFKTGECIIDDPITKTQWLTDIIVFGNTNGDIALFVDPISDNIKLFFETSSSNNEERILYATIGEEDKYIFKNENNNFIPFIRKNINRIENKELINSEICLYSLNNVLNYIISIGTRNSSIEILDIVTNDLFTYNSSYFLNSTKRIIKGISSLAYIYDYRYLFYGTVTISEDNPLIYYLTFYIHNINIFNMPQINIEFQYSTDLGNTKGDYISCFIFSYLYGHISCFYLRNDNNYVIIGIENKIDDDGTFNIKNTTIIGSPSNQNNDNIYFLKGIHLEEFQALYCYYSGENDNIPTFLIRNIDNDDFSLSNEYEEEFSVIYLNDNYYSFNNNIKYNDLSIISQNQFYFISTYKDNNFIIITHFQFYHSDGDKLLIRYYTIKLKEYYNIKILNGLQAVSFNIEWNYYLTLALDFCFHDSCQNPDEIINNSALMFLSYLNKTHDINIDFIEYAFNNNKNYIMVNFTENFKIENNIFGYYMSGILILEYIEEDGIEYYNGITDEPMDLYEDDYLDPYTHLLKINFTDYSFDTIEIYFLYQAEISPPYDVEEFNNYCDNYNNNFGVIEDESAFEEIETKWSVYSYYYININEELSIECDDSNCTLCLRDNSSYCIVCKDDNYKIIYDNKYGKLKLCTNDINIETTIIKESLSEINTTISIESTNTNSDLVTNEKLTNEISISFTDKESSNSILINTNEQSGDNYYSSSVILKTDLNSINNSILIDTEKTSEDNYYSSSIILNTDLNSINNSILIYTAETSEDNYYSSSIISKTDLDSSILTNINEKTEDYTSILSNIDLESQNNSIIITTDEKSENNYYTSIISNTELGSTINSNADKISEDNYFTTITTTYLESSNIYNFVNSTQISINDIKSTVFKELMQTEKLTNENEKFMNTDNSDINDTLIISTDLVTINNDKLIDTDKNNILTDSESSEIDKKLDSDISKNNNKLSLEDLFNNKYKDVVLSNEQIKEIYDDIKKYLLNNYDGNNKIINTSNVKIEISELDSQKDSEFSYIDLKDCMEILKDKYGDLLTMLKFDITPENEKSTYVQYEIYDSVSKVFLELKECSGSNAIINVPIDLDPEIESLYNMLSKSGYNLFDSNDSFYNDICAIYTTENGTDMLLYDRRMDIYQSTVNISLCQEGCTFKSYNSDTKKAECNCPIQTEEINTNISEFKFDKNEMIEMFYGTLKNSNFRVLNCYKLVLNIKIFAKNLGGIVMTILFSIFIILMLIYILRSSKKINLYIQNIIKYKYINNEIDNSSSKNKIKIYDNINFRKQSISNNKKIRNSVKENKNKKIKKNKGKKKT